MANKIKSNSGAAKRFKVTATGKVKHKRAYLRHNLSCKNQTQKRNLKLRGMVDETDIGRVQQMLPYSF